MTELSMITKLRRQISFQGKAEIDKGDFNQLQAEWINRSPLPESEAIRALIAKQNQIEVRLEECLGALIDVYDSGVVLMEHETAIRKVLGITK